jgi:trimeric autotransporter adhesin
MRTREKLMHPATFISLAALFVALGGVGYAATKIGTKQLRNRAVTAPKLANNSVIAAKIRTGAVGNRALANNSVSTQKIRAGAIVSSDLAVGSVLNANLGNGAVTSSNLAGDSVLNANLGNGAVTSSKLANDAVANHNLANGSVSSDKIGTGAVIASKLAAGSVTTPAIAANSITAAQIENGQVVEGNGTLSSAQVTVGATPAPVLQFAGLGLLQASCAAAGNMVVEFVNNSGIPVNAGVWGVVDDGAPDPVFAAQVLANGAALPQTVVAGDPGMGLTWTASYGAGSTLHLATINLSTAPGCVLSAQATYTS